DEADLGRRAEVGEDLAKPAQVRAVQPVAVDLRVRHHPHRDPGGAAEHGAEELFAPRRVELLRVVQDGERTDAVVAEALVVEQDARHDEGPGERAASGLVGSGDVARAKRAVEAEETATGWPLASAPSRSPARELRRQA